MPERDYTWDPEEEQRVQQRAMSDQFEREPSAAPRTTEPAAGTMPVREAPSVDRVPPPPNVQPQTFQGFTPRHAMEGFAFDREQNTGRSAKDAFAYLSNQAPPPPLNDKNALAQWFSQHIAPGMNALGHTVSGVEGDKFRLNNWQGQFDVDYGRGAGADGGALAWQVDDGTAVMPQNPTYAPRMAAAPLAPVSDEQARIRAEIDALINGDTTPMQYNAMEQLFRV